MFRASRARATRERFGPHDGRGGLRQRRPGGFPAPNCDPSDNTCPAISDACSINHANVRRSYDVPAARGQQQEGRVRLSPAPAARSRRPRAHCEQHRRGSHPNRGHYKGIDLASPACGDRGHRRVQLAPSRRSDEQQIVTGGAPPSSEPVGVGYCFYQHLLGSLDVEPSTTTVTFNARALHHALIPLLNVPIFLAPDAGAADPANVIILPLRGAVLENARSRTATTASARSTLKPSSKLAAPARSPTHPRAASGAPRARSART